MLKFVVVVLMAVCCAMAKPGLVAPVAYSAPLVAAAPAAVVAQSSQVFSRNYNGIAASLAYTAAAPLAYSAPLTAAPLGYSAYAAAPLGYSAYPYAASPYVASPYAAYRAGPVLL